jgi:hypothetical protein
MSIAQAQALLSARKAGRRSAGEDGRQGDPRWI